jgi:hypothetical protein
MARFVSNRLFAALPPSPRGAPRFGGALLRGLLLGSALFGALLLAPLSGWAQPHFDACAARTATNATVILPTGSVFIGDRAVDYGDEIAVYSPDGRCAGAVTWTGVNTALTVWGYDSLSAAAGTVGLRPGAPLLFRVWDASAGTEAGGRGAFALELAAGDPPLTAEPRYAPGAVYRVLDLTAFRRPAASNE